MTGIGVGFAGIGLMVVLIAMRVPIGLTLISVSFGGIWYLLGMGPAWGVLKSVPYNFSASWTLSSIPMFLLMGFICFHAQLTKGLFEAARLWLSRLPGGLAISAIFGAAGFAAVTGSSVACAAAMGRIAVPEMMRNRYDVSLATGTVAAAGTIGAMIPPSILMIVYGYMSGVPISHLFMGGISAGLLTIVGYLIVVLIWTTVKPSAAPRVEAVVPIEKKIAALWDIWPVVLLMGGVFTGLFSGAFTATEAGAIGAFLAFVIAGLKRSLSWTVIKNALLETVVTTASILIITVGASLFSRFLALSGTGDFISSSVVALGANPYMIILGITLLYLLLGMFLEAMGAMLLTLPVVLPIIIAADFNLVWFGILLVKYLEIGMLTPPIGLNVFVIKGVVGDLTTTGKIFKGVVWFLVADLFIILALVMFPDIVLYLPSLMSK